MVDNNIQYCSIVQGGIGGTKDKVETSFIIGGEVDCVMGAKLADKNGIIPWIELKTSRQPYQDQQSQAQFERKLCKFWAQSYLLGVPTIIVGFRDDQGYLTKIQELDTQRIPGQVARAEGTWDGSLCVNLTDAFLKLLKQTIGSRDGVWRIKRGKNSKIISIVQVESTGTGSIISTAFKQHREKVLALEIASKLANT